MKKIKLNPNPVLRGMSQTCKNVINHFRNDIPIRLYKVKNVKDERTGEYVKQYSKEEFDEFVGLLYSISPDQVVNIVNSNIYDVTSSHLLHVYDLDLDFKIDDRISIGEIGSDNFCFEIVGIDGEIETATIHLRGCTWT